MYSFFPLSMPSASVEKSQIQEERLDDEKPHVLLEFVSEHIKNKNPEPLWILTGPSWAQLCFPFTAPLSDMVPLHSDLLQPCCLLVNRVSIIRHSSSLTLMFLLPNPNVPCSENSGLISEQIHRWHWRTHRKPTLTYIYQICCDFSDTIAKNMLVRNDVYKMFENVEPSVGIYLEKTLL